jgi:prepilin-type N-terminal cleavage/methylation domain-containing protein
MMKLYTDNVNLAEKRKVAEGGFSLPELLVSIVIFLIVTGSMFGLMEITRIDRNRASRRSDTLKNARAAIHLIGRDALNAGLSYNLNGGMVPEGYLSSKLGIAADINNTRDTLNSIISGNNINTNNLIVGTTAKTDLITFAYRDMDFNGGDKIQLNGASAVTGSPNKTSVTTIAGGAANAVVNDLYLIETADGKQLAVMATKVDAANNKIEFSPGDPLNINQPFNGTGESGSLLKPCDPPNGVTENCTVYVALLKRFYWVSYKVNAEGTLVRTIYGNNRAGTVISVNSPN